MAIDLKTILEPAILRRVWKEARKHERQVHLTAIPLVRDSTGGISFDLNLDEALRNLQLRLLDGTYRPHAPIIIESAKSKLLHRRLSFLSFEDGLILGALVHGARASLLKEMPEWVSFGRIDRGVKGTRNQGINTLDYEGWWTKWLQYRRLLKVIEGDANPLLVVSDITDFFGSIDLSLMRSKVSSQTSLDEKANNLLFYLLENLRPAEGYSPSGSFGIPTVADDTSRILAHFFLAELDDELAEEGQQGRYTRWVDDMVISVPDAVQGAKVVARIERALSRLGLVANSSKTSLVTKEAFRKSHIEEENDYLDAIHEATDSEKEIASVVRQEFEERLCTFLTSPQEGQWSRVLRRYYTESRRIRSETLLTEWDNHLAEFPTNGKHILDYVSFFPGNLEFCKRLFEYVRSQGHLFEDIQILLYETLLLKPFPDETNLRHYVLSEVSRHFLGEDGFEAAIGYVRGLQALTMYKFGGSEGSTCFASTFEEDVLKSPTFATYGMPVLAASEQHRQLAFDATEQIQDARILRVRALIERLEHGDSKATGVLLGLMQPRSTKLPTSWIMNSRALPLLKIALRSSNANAQQRISAAKKNLVTKLSNVSEWGLVDSITLSHLK